MASRAAISVLVILLVAFILSAAVPLAQNRISASVPASGSFTEQYGGGFVFLNGSVNVTNGGYYPITNMQFNSSVLSPNGTQVYSYGAPLPAVPSRDQMNLPLSIRIPASVIIGIFAQSGTNSLANLNLSMALAGKYALSTVSFIVHFSTNVQVSSPAVLLAQTKVV